MPDSHSRRLYDKHDKPGVDHFQPFPVEIHFFAPFDGFANFVDENDHRNFNDDQRGNVTEKTIENHVVKQISVG